MAQPSERAEGDPLPPDPLLDWRELEWLLAMQDQILRSYFRLQEAHRVLRARRSAPHSPGVVVAEALERERQRLGRELHTGVGQALVAIHLHLGLLQESLPEPPEPVRESIERIDVLARNALELVQGISRRLYVPPWQAQPLVAALRDLWETSGIPQRFDGSVDLAEPAADLPLDVRAALYRTAQEGLSNAIRHSQARRVRLSLREEPGRIVLEVDDDGRGFDAPRHLTQPGGSGIGLHSMCEVARRLGGDLRVHSGPQGTRLTISLPVNL